MPTCGYLEPGDVKELSATTKRVESQQYAFLFILAYEGLDTGNLGFGNFE